MEGLYVGKIIETKHYGSYIIEEIISSSVKTGGVRIKFIDCGSVRITDAKSARNGNVSPKKKTKIKIGDKFSRLTVVDRISDVGARNTKWLCICECGGIARPTTIALTAGHTTSCGCYAIEATRESSTTHGGTGTKEYIVWASMKRRCFDKNHDAYYRYGARGITVCEEWKNNFSKFLEDMGKCPDGLALERKDPNKNYCKENCKWDTHNMQGYNTNIRSNNTSGRTGIYFNKNQNKWTAAIGAEFRLIHLGTFNTFEDALIAREEAEIKYYGFNKE
jgi:hypothetical protein